MADAKALQKRVNQLSAAVKADPGSIARRLELAAALRDLGRKSEAVELYRGVALLYAEEGRFAQAIAVCRGILEIDPSHNETSELLQTIAAKRAGRERAAQPVTPMSQWAANDFAEVPSSPWANEDLATPPPPALQQAVNAIMPSLAEDEEERTPAHPDAPAVEAAMAAVEAAAQAEREERAAETLRLEREQRAEKAVRSVEARDETAPYGKVEPDVETDPAVRPRVRMDVTSPDLVQPGSPEEDALLAQALGAPWPPPNLEEEPPPFPLLGELPRAAFLELTARLKVRREPAETWLVREGEPGDACFLISSGRVRVVKNGVEVARLQTGSFFGEFAVLADQRRHASVQTMEPVELLEISRVLLDELTQAHPGVARTLRRFYRERLLDTLVATAPFFEPLTPEERVAVAGRFRPRRFGRGVPIIEEGQPGGGLYLILVGEVEVVRGEKDAEVRLAALGEGSYFGEMSLLRGGVASATVRAVRMTEAVQLGPRDFYEVAAAHPVLWDALRTEAARRELLNHAILAGEARKSGDGIYLV